MKQTKTSVPSRILVGVSLLLVLVSGYQVLSLGGMREALTAAHPYNPEISIQYFYDSLMLLVLLGASLLAAIRLAGSRGDHPVKDSAGHLLVMALTGLSFRLVYGQIGSFISLADEFSGLTFLWTAWTLRLLLALAAVTTLVSLVKGWERSLERRRKSGAALEAQ